MASFKRRPLESRNHLKMKVALLISLASLVAVSACRKRSAVETGGGGESAPQTAGTASAPAAGKAIDPAAVAAPLPPPDAEITASVERRFRPKELSNAYAPAGPGDYQAQLNLYNRVLRKWVADQGYLPNTMQELMASSGTPKPPQPPAGRTLVFDRRTVSVVLQ